MKKYINNFFILTLTIVICVNIQTMENNEVFLRKKEAYEKSIEAKEYNVQVLLPNDILNHVFSYLKCDNKDIRYVLESRNLLFSHIVNDKKREGLIAYYQIKTLFAIHQTCHQFHVLMPLNDIIQFCKTLPQDIKNNALLRTIPNINNNYDPFLWTCSSFFVPKLKDNYDNNNICLTLMKAGADTNIKYDLIHKKKLSKNHMSILSQAITSNDPSALSLVKCALQNGANPNETDSQGNPIFFFAQTKEIAQLFINKSCNLQAANRENNNVLSHVINKKYPANLMQLYIEQNVAQQHNLFLRFIGLMSDYYEAGFTDQFLQKCAVLLKSITKGNPPTLWLEELIKPFLNSIQEEFNKLYHMYGNIKNLKLFKQNVIELFENHGYSYEKTSKHPKIDYYLKNRNGITINDDAYDDDDLQTALQLSMMDINEQENLLNLKEKEEKTIVQIYITKGVLIEAVQSNDSDKVLMVLNDKNEIFDINEQDKVGNTALIYATMNKNNKIIQCLLDKGAKKDITNHIGRAAFDLAMDAGDNDLAELLMEIED